MNTTSASLLQRLRQPGQPEAWARFVDLYTPLLVYWARRLGLTPEDTRDFVQDVFTALVEKLPDFTYDRGKSFRGWLRTVALNKWRDHKRRKAIPRAPGPVPLAELPGPDEAEAFWELEFKQHLTRRALEVMQAEFKPTTWKACWEFVVSSRPAAEVAQELGITENAVYIAKSKVLRRLRQELAGLLDE
jgi:RNA polymerase sigma-70 factor (ECF subfamily)